MSRIVAKLIIVFCSTVAWSSPMRPTVLKGVRLTSCHEAVCARLESDTVFRSPLSPETMAFGAAVLVITQQDGSATAQRFEAEDGYYDMQTQVIVLRGLKRSSHRELIYNLARARFVFF